MERFTVPGAPTPGTIPPVSRDERADLAGLIRDFYGGLVPRVVPLTLLRHFIRKFAVGYPAVPYSPDPIPGNGCYGVMSRKSGEALRWTKIMLD